MAIRLFHGEGNSGGNTNITLGGYWNAGDPPGDVWASPFNGATAYTVALTVMPDNPMTEPDPLWDQPGHLTNLAWISLMHCAGGQWGTSQWQITHAGAGAILSAARNYQVGINYAITSAGTLTPGQWYRIFIHFRASDNAHSIWVNGVNRTASTWSVDNNGNPIAGIPSLTYASGNHAAPLQVGSEDQYDLFPFCGAYCQVACWNAYLPDADAIAYGHGASPSALSNIGRVAYVTLKPETIGPRRPVGTYAATHPDCSIVGPDEWTGVLYGEDLATYQYGGPTYQAPYQGVFDYYQVVSDPGPSLLKPDVEILPQREFETWERLGAGHIGKRSGNVYTVAAATPTALQNAVNSVTGYGDEVVIPAGYMITMNGASISFPDARNWTKDATTPRCVPPAQRAAVHGRLQATTKRSVARARVAQRARVAAGEPSYVLIRSSNLAALPTPSFRHIRLPDGTTVHGLHEDGKVTPDHAALMPVLAMGTTTAAPFWVATGNAWADHWHIQGACMLGTSQANAGEFFTLTGIYHETLTWHIDTNPYLYPGKMAFNQCLFLCDPEDRGYSGSNLGRVDSVAGVGFFNCWFDKFWTD